MTRAIGRCPRCGSQNVVRGQLSPISYASAFENSRCLQCGWTGEVRLHSMLDPTTSSGRKLWTFWAIGIVAFAVALLLVIAVVFCVGFGFLMSLAQPPQ